jgi:hypothetical protein
MNHQTSRRMSRQMNHQTSRRMSRRMSRRNRPIHQFQIHEFQNPRVLPRDPLAYLRL